MYLGAKIFDDLPVEVRKHCKGNNFNSILKNHFKFILILLKVLYVLLSILVYLSTYPTQCFTIFDFYRLWNTRRIVSQKCSSNSTMLLEHQ